MYLLLISKLSSANHSVISEDFAIDLCLISEAFDHSAVSSCFVVEKILEHDMYLSFSVSFLFPGSFLHQIFLCDVRPPATAETVSYVSESF